VADDDTGSGADQPTLAEVDDRVGKIETAVTTMQEALQRALGGAHKDAAATTEERLDQNSTIAAEVQRELARAAREQDEQALRGKVDTVAETVARLQETPPAPPVRRVEKIMGWHG
jgi:Skp family chaperone for outer membrane proteins